jgi:predicted aspartyl protease
MGKANDCYAITLFDNEGTLNHVIFDIQLRIKHIPEVAGNAPVSTIKSWPAAAVVDTGATISGITGRMAKRMGINSHGEYSFTHAKGKGALPVYVFDVVFPKGKIFENIEAVEISDDHEFDFLIGMNIISQGDMALTSVNGKAAFSFRVPPAEKYIDFEYDLMKSQD